jgi:hypothetical protein
MEVEIDNKKFLSPKDACKKYPIFTMHGLRHHIRRNKKDIQKCILKVGGRVWIDCEKFEHWINEQYMGKDA